MSGHSKWAQIHRQKGAADAKKGVLFTKLGNAITIAAKISGGNPDTNFKLKLAIDQAKAANMPKENIQRAIKRGTGELSGGQLEEVVYEGFGPDGIAVVVECLTDNRNRTSSEMKHIFSKYGGSLGGPNSVAWQFEKRGIIRTEKINEEQELKLIDLGATDFQEEDQLSVIYCQPNNLAIIKEYLEENGVKIDYAEVEQIPKDKKSIIDPKALEKIEKFFQELDDAEDVNNYYTNTEI